ncbi:hypothetical protein TNIN_299531 [Trichonephila inaurata madagascariensis]|uniref:Uncharacterized protein n=1 Tax=Trichonephila inaurata madagascariensis TaxID=2747483 RepID=A0A8X6YZ44_9ARAC|nr:hypothetical protein TNIN_299531 [Trichonephila inaurata madagascariensis]
MVSTLDSESSDPSSNLGGTLRFATDGIETYHSIHLEFRPAANIPLWVQKPDLLENYLRILTQTMTYPCIKFHMSSEPRYRSRQRVSLIILNLEKSEGREFDPHPGHLVLIFGAVID